MTELAKSHPIHIDRPRGSVHPDWPELLYPLDYGYLEGTMASDGDGIDVWIGSLEGRHLTGIICNLDPLKHELEVKLLLGCTSKEVEIILAFHSHDMPTLYIPNSERQP